MGFGGFCAFCISFLFSISFNKGIKPEATVHINPLLNSIRSNTKIMES